MGKKRIIILGAGLAGLSTAWHLEKKGIDYLIFEKEPEVGGLCRSKKINGFTFDYDGHLLHFRHCYAFNLIKKLLGNNLLRYQRRALIYTYGRYTHYPFQVNLYGLPSLIVKECLSGFIKTCNNGKLNKKKNPNFSNWIECNFGRGIAKHFMIPYNTKFWTVSPKELTCDWIDGFIPVPSLTQIIEGSIEESQRQFGYNSTFWYPRRGGMQEVARALSNNLKNITSCCEVTNINIRTKKIFFKNGAVQSYDKLIFSLPLPEVLRIVKNLPGGIIRNLKKLKYTSVFNLNLGINRRGVSDAHWIYFPESKFIFYRIGFPSNFSFNLAPKGASSVYTEVSYSRQKQLNQDISVDKIIDDLIKANILYANDKILVKDINDIKYAYIIYDQFRKTAVENIKNFLNQNNIFCVGRYGSWSYMSMEDVILQGKQTAETLK